MPRPGLLRMRRTCEACDGGSLPGDAWTGDGDATHRRQTENAGTYHLGVDTPCAEEGKKVEERGRTGGSRGSKLTAKWRKLVNNNPGSPCSGNSGHDRMESRKRIEKRQAHPGPGTFHEAEAKRFARLLGSMMLGASVTQRRDRLY